MGNKRAPTVLPGYASVGSRKMHYCERTMIVNDYNFADVLGAECPVLLNLGAPWCRSCQSLAPILKRVVAMFAGKIILAEANVDDCPALRRRLGLSMLPTLILFTHGTEVARTKGFCLDTELVEFVINALKSGGL